MDKRGIFYLIAFLLLMSFGTSIMSNNISHKFREMYPNAYAVSVDKHRRIDERSDTMRFESHSYEFTGVQKEKDGIIYDEYRCTACDFYKMEVHEEEENEVE